MLGGKIVSEWRVWSWLAGFADATFCGNEHVLAHGRHFLQNLAKNFFGHAVAVDVGMIKERIAGFIGCDDRLLSGSSALRRDFGQVPGAGDAPTAVSETAAGEITFANANRFHCGNEC